MSPIMLTIIGAAALIILSMVWLARQRPYPTPTLPLATPTPPVRTPMPSEVVNTIANPGLPPSTRGLPAVDALPAIDGELVLSQVRVVQHNPTSSTRPTNVSAYRTTRHGDHVFRMAFVQLSPRNFRAYIIDMPSYGTRASDAHTTHKLWDSNCRLHYICWDTSITSTEDLLKVSREWCELTTRYIVSGTRFESPDPTRSQHDEMQRQRNRS